MRVARTGGTPVKLADAKSPKRLVVDATRVYWTADDWVGSVPIAGGPAKQLATGQKNPARIAVDERFVYWSNEDGPSVSKAPIDGSAVPTDVVTDQANPDGVTVDSANVYWNAYGKSSLGDTVVAKMPKGGGPAVVLASGKGGGQDLLVDSTHVYWLTGFGQLWRVPIAGGAADRLADGQGVARYLWLTADTIHWTSSSYGNVMALPKNSSEPIEIATGQNNPHGIAAIDRDVYWTNTDDGTIMHVAR